MFTHNTQHRTRSNGVFRNHLRDGIQQVLLVIITYKCACYIFHPCQYGTGGLNIRWLRNYLSYIGIATDPLRTWRVLHFFNNFNRIRLDSHQQCLFWSPPDVRRGMEIFMVMMMDLYSNVCRDDLEIFRQQRNALYGNNPFCRVVYILLVRFKFYVAWFSVSVTKWRIDRAYCVADHGRQWFPAPPMPLKHWDRDRIAAVFQNTFSNAFSCTKIYEFRLWFHCSLLSRAQIIIVSVLVQVVKSESV